MLGLTVLIVSAALFMRKLHKLIRRLVGRRSSLFMWREAACLHHVTQLAYPCWDLRLGEASLQHLLLAEHS